MLRNTSKISLKKMPNNSSTLPNVRKNEKQKFEKMKAC